MINVKQRYDAVKKHKLCFGYLGKAHDIKDCKVNPCGIDGCDRKHNRLLHENRSGRRPMHQESTNSYSVPSRSGVLPIIRLQLTNLRTGESMETCALEDTGSTVTLKDKSLEKSLKLSSKDCKRELAGANISISITEGVTVKVSTKSLKLENNNCLAHPDFSVVSMNYDYSTYKRRFP